MQLHNVLSWRFFAQLHLNGPVIQ
uniref:Uncharacterized protein n=1 Tax=Anguilla anguilla TaxID=7936 RepID=A0A0E9SQR5_ANGAN